MTNSRANLLLTREANGTVRRWREVSGEEWDRASELMRDILHLKAEQRIAFVVRIKDHE